MNPATQICPVCEQGTLRPEIYSEEIHHNGVTLAVSGLERYRCSHCDADPVLRDQIRRNQVRLCDARRLADGLLTSEKIRSLRERCGLSQAEAATIFGGGENAFSKYERGEVIQGRSMDRLLRCAEAFPLLVGHLRDIAGVTAHGASAACAYSRATDSLTLNDRHYTSRLIRGASAVLVSKSNEQVVVPFDRRRKVA